MSPKKEKVRLILTMIVAFLLAAGAPSFAGPNSPKKDNPKISVSGHIVYCHVIPDAGANVKLFDYNTGTQVGSATANFFGYYTISTNRLECHDGALYQLHTLKVKAKSTLFWGAKAHRFIDVTLDCKRPRDRSFNGDLAPFSGTHKWKENHWH